MRQRPTTTLETKPQVPSSKPQVPSPKSSAIQRKKKRSFKEEREYAELPNRIAALEDEHKRLQSLLGDSTFYTKPGSEIKEVVDRVEQIDRELLEAMARWDQLDSIG